MYTTMPYKRNYRRRKTRRGGALATRPRMMTRTKAFKRLNQVSTHVMYFKTNGVINTPIIPAVTRYLEFRGVQALGNIPQFQGQSQYYDQYKLLGFKVRWFPANVGIESHDATLGTDFTLKRGNQVIWSDQRFDPAQPQPTAISDIINTASARLINPRRPYSRALWRPKGKYIWGSMKDYATTGADPWTGVIQQFIQDSTNSTVANPATLFFYTIMYKVVFRGRIQD